MKTPLQSLKPTPAAAATLLAIMSILGCGDAGEAQGNDKTLIVFAAASTTEVIEALAAAYADATGIDVRPSFASSSTLARQIEAGAPADVFLSANPEWMDRLAERSLLRDGSRVDLLANQLVLVTPADRTDAFDPSPAFDIASAIKGRLALGDPDHVPAGIYARQALESLGWWDRLADRLVPAPDVRSALLYAQRGDAGAAIVYASDARSAAGVRIAMTFPPDSHEPIRYPVAAIAGASPAADGFIAYLRSAEARAAFEAAGFILPDEP